MKVYSINRKSVFDRKSHGLDIAFFESKEAAHLYITKVCDADPAVCEGNLYLDNEYSYRIIPLFINTLQETKEYIADRERNRKIIQDAIESQENL